MNIKDANISFNDDDSGMLIIEGNLTREDSSGDERIDDIVSVAPRTHNQKKLSK